MGHSTKFKRYLAILCNCGLIWAWTLGECFAQKSLTPLTLEQAIRKALENNRQVQLARLGRDAAELSYETSWHQMFLPTLEMSASTTSSTTVGVLPNTPAKKTGGENSWNRGFPAAQAKVGLANFTVFNFWKDQLAYEMARLTWERAREQYSEAERSIRNQITGAYFQLKTEQETLDTAKRSLEITEAILELIRDREKLGKAVANDIASTQNDVLAAKNQFNQIAQNVRSLTWALNQQIGDPLDTEYQLKTDIAFKPIQLQGEEAYKIYQSKGPNLKNSKLQVKTSELNVEIQEKNRLPLPTVSISGVSLAWTAGHFGGTSSPYTTGSNPQGNIELQTTATVTIPIFGPTGFFNHRQIAAARIQRDQVEITYQQTVLSDMAKIFTSIASIRQQEQGIENLNKSFSNATQILNHTMEQISKTGVSRLEIRDAVNNARTLDIQLKNAYLEHLTEKLALAELLGIDALPGEETKTSGVGGRK